jgi:hypothetical protein
MLNNHWGLHKALKIELTRIIGVLYSPQMFMKKLQNPFILKGLLLSALIIIGNFYLSERCLFEEKGGRREINPVLPFTSISEQETADSADVGTKDVTGKKAPSSRSTVWLLAVDMVNSIGKSINQRQSPSQNFADLVPLGTSISQNKSIHTICLVNAELGSLFTLVGEKPSGTS